MTTHRILVSVVIPLMEISKYVIEEGLPAFTKQTYHDFEVILLPNKKNQSDETLLKRYPFLRIIETDTVTRPAQKRDIGVKHARGGLIAFIDDDAYPDKNWLKTAAALIDTVEMTTYTGKTVAVCGPGIVPENGALWEKVFQTVLASRLGSGGYTYRFRHESARFVDDYPSMNFIVRKDVFENLGGFDNDFWPGEDSKLCEDIVYKLKSKILYDPNVLVYHHRRPYLKHFLKQHGAYGYHRGAFFAHGDRNSRRISYLIPTFFVGYILFIIYYLFRLNSTSLNQFQLSSLLPLIIYGLLLLFHLLSVLFKTKSLKISMLSTIVLVLMHIYYGIKFIHGFVIGLIRKDKIYG